jgi:hypothetical protein
VPWPFFLPIFPQVRRSPCRRLSARVRSATRSSRLSESRRSTSDAASGSTAARHSLHEAANAVARASRLSFLRALPAKLESTRTRKLGRHVNHELAGRCQPPRQVTTEPAGDLHRPTALGEPSGPALERPQACAVLREASTLEELAATASSIAATATDALWGSTRSRPSCARTSVSVGPLCHHWRARRTFRLRAVLPHLF